MAKTFAVVFFVATILLTLYVVTRSTSNTHFNTLKKKKQNESTNIMGECTDPNYTKKTLKTASEQSFAALFYDRKDQKKFEASDVVKVKDSFFVVFDNLYAIGRVHGNFPLNDKRNVLVGQPGIDSGYEAIAYNHQSGRFYVVVESLPHHQAISMHKNRSHSQAGGKQKKIADTHAVIREMNISDSEDRLIVFESCPTEFTFPAENKGFEGIGLLPKKGSASPYLLGLCEGNYCAGGAKGRQKGNGMILVLSRVEYSNSSSASPAQTKTEKKVSKSFGETVTCWWETVAYLPLPSGVLFQDYSALAIRQKDNLIAITSQETSQLWIGELDWSSSDPNEWSFVDEGTIYDFPRDENCEVVYCNIEGIDWVTPHIFVAVSDKMKSKGRQPARCFEKDQSIHLFVLP